MPQEFTKGSAAIATGTTTAWGITSTFGNIGVAAGGTAFGVGAVPIMGAGAIAGVAAYGAYRGFSERDPIALGSLGLGAAAGAGVSAGIGGVGVVGGLGGFGLGLGAMSTLGGVAGLGLYGIAKMLDSGSKESSFAAFSRMEERIDEDLAYSMAYTSALIELFLPEDDIFRTIFEYDVEADLDALKEELATAKISASPLVFSELKPIALGTDLSQATWLKLRQFKPSQTAINDVVIYHQESRVLVACEDGSVIDLNLSTGKRRCTFTSPKSVLAIALNPHNNTLICGGQENSLSNWNLETQQLIEMPKASELARGEARFTCALAFGQTGKYFASAGTDQVVTLWCPHELYPLRYRTRRSLKGHQNTVLSLAFTPDEKALVSASADATIRIWDLTSWNAPKVLLGHRGAVHCIAICPTHLLLVSAGQDATLRFWDLETGELLKTIQAHEQAIRFLAFSPDGSRLVSSGNDNLTKIWQVDDQEICGESREIIVTRQATLTGSGPVAFYGSGRILVQGDRAGKITLWQLHW